MGIPARGGVTIATAECAAAAGVTAAAAAEEDAVVVVTAVDAVAIAKAEAPPLPVLCDNGEGDKDEPLSPGQ